MYCELYNPPTESTVANSFPRGAFPEYRLDCTQLSNGAWHCSPVEQQCDSFMELGVICKSYENLYNECSTNCTMSTMSTTMQVTTSSEGKQILSACKDQASNRLISTHRNVFYSSSNN